MKKRRRLPWLPMVIASLLMTLWLLDGWLTQSASAVQRSSMNLAAGQNAVQETGGADEQGEQATAEQIDVEGLLEGLDLERPGPSPDDQGEQPKVTDSETPPLIGAYLAMREAGSRLTAGELGEETQAVQQRAIDLLDQLINMAQADEETGAAQSGSSQSSPNQQNESGEQQSESEPRVTDAGEDAADRPDQSGEGGEGEQPQEDQSPGDGDQQPQQSGEEHSQGPAGDGNPEDQQVAFPAAGDVVPMDAAGQAVWGHLPKRVRGLLRAEAPTEYLPGYSDEISAYFRALAEMKPDE